jgi:hypothetical protein
MGEIAMKTHKLHTRVVDRRGAFEAFLVIRGRRATLRLKGYASGVGFDDDEAIDEFAACERLAAYAVRTGATRIGFEVDATLDGASTSRLAELLLDLNRRGVATSLGTNTPTRAAIFRTEPGAVLSAWPKSFAEWERFVFRAGLLLSAIMGWLEYFHFK